MKPHQWEVANRIFLAAADLPERNREAFLARECGDDAELRGEVERLLRGDVAAKQGGDSLLTPGAVNVRRILNDNDPAEETEAILHGRNEQAKMPARSVQAPQRIGPYKVLETLGEGGMGVVYLAEQEQPIHRRVALKIMKLGMDTKQVLARFEAEREALAVMDHPSVAKVLDAGVTPEGRPYFVMEFVSGIRITDYCDRNRLSTEDRLHLFMDVCYAVQHAHQKGIIHRDLKPSNVLVALFEGRPIPKVIDFGVAKATQHRLTDQTLFTEHGQIIGTPGYMSPEQAEMTALGVDTRTDIYSLGVLLYELLVGSLPFDKEALRKAGQAEIQRIIREVDPPRPSTRLTGLGEASTEIAHRRRADPGTLARQLRRDLDWVVMKCLEKDRTRRYETADGLARDVQRYLRHEPVQAGPPSAMYGFRKFVQRHRTGVAAAALIVAALIVGVVTTSRAARWARREQAAALAARDAEKAAKEVALQREKEVTLAKALVERRSQDLEEVVQFLAAMVSGINVEQMGRSLLEDLRTEIRTALERDGRAGAEIEARLTAMDEAVRDANMTNVAVRTVERNILKQALEAVARKFAGQPLVEASLLQTVSDTLRDLGLYEAAIPPQQRAWELRKHELGDEHRDTLASLRHLAVLREKQGQLAEAEQHHRQALEGRRRQFGEDDADTLQSMNDLGWVLHRQGRLQEAEPLVRQALVGRRAVLGNDHPDTLLSANDLGWLLKALDRKEEAEPLLREAWEGRRRVLGSDHVDTLESLHNLGALLRVAGKLEQAEPLLREAVDRRRRVLGDAHSDTLISINALALTMKGGRKYAEAEPLYREALDGFRRALGEDHPDTLSALNNLGMLLLTQKRLSDAEPYLLDALERRRRVLGSEHFGTLTSLSNVGLVLKEQGKRKEAERYYREAVDRSRRVLGATHRDTLVSVNNLAALLEADDKFAEAETLLLDTYRSLTAAGETKPERLAECAKRLAALYEAWHKKEPTGGYDAKAAEYRTGATAGGN